MKVKVIRSFVDGKYGRKSKGDEIELPNDVDWLKAGFVEPLGVEIESASVEPPQKAVITKTNARPKKPRARKATAKK